MRLPLAIFLIINLVLLGVCLAIISSTYAAHIRGDNFRLETNYLYVDFPKNWYVAPWENKSITGTISSILLVPPDYRGSMFFMVYDEKASKVYLKENNVTDAASLTIVEVKRLHNWILDKNISAPLHFIENGTRTLFGREAAYSTFMVEGGYINEEGQPQNWTWTFMSIIDGIIYQVAYHGVGEDYELAYENFQLILNQTKINHGEGD